MADYRPPDTDTYSIKEVTPDLVQVGDVCRFAFVNEATVEGITPATDEEQPHWFFFWNSAMAVAFVPDPVFADDSIWTSVIEQRHPDPALRDFWERPDGSRWIYHEDTVGVYFLCVVAGSEFDAGDLVRGDAPLYVSVDGPADVEIGNTYRFVLYQTSTVDAVYPPGDPGGSPDGWFFDVTLPDDTEDGVLVPTVPAEFLTMRIYVETPKPAAESLWYAQDASEWVWPGDVPYYRCYSASETWPINSCALAEQLGPLTPAA